MQTLISINIYILLPVIFRPSDGEISILEFQVCYGRVVCGVDRVERSLEG